MYLQTENSPGQQPAVKRFLTFKADASVSTLAACSHDSDFVHELFTINMYSMQGIEITFFISPYSVSRLASITVSGEYAARASKSKRNETSLIIRSWISWIPFRGTIHHSES